MKSMKVYSETEDLRLSMDHESLDPIEKVK